MINGKKMFLVVLLVFGITCLLFSGGGSQAQSGTATSEVNNTEVTSLVSVDIIPNENQTMLPELRRRTGVNFRPTYITPLDYNNRLNAMISAGTLPDIIAHISLAIGVDLVKYGALKELTGLLNEYGQDILADREGLLSYGINDSTHIYGIPGSPWYPLAIAVRKDWTRNVGNTVPATNVSQMKITDFVNLMRKFSHNNPNGDGRSTWGYAFVIKNIGLAAPIFNAFDVPMQGTGSYGAPGWFVDSSGKLRYYLNHPNFLKGMEIMRTLYQERLINPDFLTVPTNSEEWANFFAGKLGAAGWSPAGPTNNWIGRYVDGLQADDFYYVELVDDSGSGGGSYLPPSTSFFGISSTAKYPEGAMKVMNYINTEEGDVFTYFGVEGKQFKWIDKANYKVEYLPPYNDTFLHRGDGYWNLNGAFKAVKNNAELRSLTPITRDIINYMRPRLVKDSVYISSVPAIKTETGTTLDEIEIEIFANLMVSTGDLAPQFRQLMTRWETAGGKLYEEQADAIYKAEQQR